MKPDTPYVALKPFLICKDDGGLFRLTVRETRYNSQGYPLVTATLVEQTFKTAAAARIHAADEYRAKPGEFASK
jgi:hypothetical protein